MSSIGSGIVYLALGIASLVISISQYPTVTCGFNGSPPLREWVFGTGVAYTVIGGCASIAGVLLFMTVIGAIPVLIVLGCSGLFTFAWTIVGAVALWRDGSDCQSLAYSLWAVAMADVIVGIVIIVGTIFATRTTMNSE